MSDSLSDALHEFEQDAIDMMHEKMAEGLAEQMRELGRDTADGVAIETDVDSDDPKWQIDVERVRRRANEILAS